MLNGRWSPISGTSSLKAVRLVISAAESAARRDAHRLRDVLVFQRHDTWLCDREALAVWLQRSPETIRKRCPVAEYHTDGRALYDMYQCEAILGDVPTRK